MKIAILALQGAFAEHEQMLKSLGVETKLIRNLEDLPPSNSPLKGENKKASPLGGGWEGSGLVIPGGESTSMMRIMKDEGLFDPIREAIEAGLPVLGTCAGLIMLDRNHLDVMDIVGNVGRIGNFVMTFIRAPYIEEAGPEIEALATVEGKIVAARQKNMLVTAFHPELTADTRIHELFLKIVEEGHSSNL